MKDTLVLLTSTTAALFAQSPAVTAGDPLIDRLANFGGMAVVAGVALYLLRNSIKDFRDSLEAQRKSHTEAMIVQRAEWDRERAEYVSMLKDHFRSLRDSKE